MYYITIDLGATSGRVLLFNDNDNSFNYKIISRFSTKFIEDEDGDFVWPIKKIFTYIKEGLKKVSHLNIRSIGIDSWAVDFLLVDCSDLSVSKAISYRDPRTSKIKILPKEFFGKYNLYAKNGIYPHIFNTINQLTYLKENNFDFTNKKMLLIPDYLNFLLTGKMFLEYTNMSTTGMLNEQDNCLDEQILNFLNMKENNFPSIVKPGHICGTLDTVLKKELGFTCDIDVVNVASHDTASAFLAATYLDNSVILVSGTWSLLGVISNSLHNSKQFLDFNFSNEGGFDNSYRLLKNVMGMWVLECICKEFDYYDYSKIIQDVRNLESFNFFLDLDKDIFINPKSMKKQIQDECSNLKLPIPNTQAEFAKIIFTSLAKIYANNITQLENLLNTKFSSINIMGGGSQNEYLNELIEKYSNLKVIKGPIEASAFGNYLIQALATKNIDSLNQGKDKLLKEKNEKFK